MLDFVTGDLSNFHFIRPWWLSALLLIPLVTYLSKKISVNSLSWAQVIDDQLLSHLISEEHRTKRPPIFLLALAWLFATLALAGPAWQKIPQPVLKVEDALVVVLDLSLSMQATDITPSRLVKARHKILDLLSQREQGFTGLIVYAGDAHIVSPLSDDAETIKSMIPALSPLIMPAMGSDAVRAIELATELLENGGVTSGKILLISDEISESQSRQIAEITQLEAHQLALLSVGTSEGSPIPLPESGFLKNRGEIVIAKTDQRPFKELASATGARYTNLRLDDADLQFLLPPQSNPLSTQTREVEREFDQWREEGPWLLLFLLPIAAFAFRRGWVMAIATLLILPSQPATAFEWQDLWHTPDQQAAQAYERGDHERASELFKSKEWKAAAAYKSENYESAIDILGAENGAQAHYNLGNALAKSGKLPEAIGAYEQALELSPDHEDASFNKALLEQLLEQQQQSGSSEDEQDQKQDQNQQQDSQGQENQQGTDQQQESEQEQAADGSQDSSQNQQQNAENEPSQQASEEADKSEQEQSAESGANEKQDKQPVEEPQNDTEQDPANGEQNQSLAAQNVTELDPEEQQALEQWLRRIPDDPGGLLKRKFDYQYRQRQKQNQFLPPDQDAAKW